GATGIAYNDLLRFAEPLFELYELDFRSAADRKRDRDAEEIAGLLAVLDLARLLWAYFQLDSAEMDVAHDHLRTALIGAEPDPDEEQALNDLLELMQERWIELRDTAARPPEGFVLPPFADLLRDFERSHAEDAATGFPMSTDLPDALASFALPLLESTNLEDPAEVDDALARAQAYWELAQTSGPAYKSRLEGLAERFASNRRSAEAVRREAETMTRRYRDLFG
ncbi:MAG TPA: hypothetical protein VF190_14215, partial [Rhodothermales bacterium]